MSWEDCGMYWAWRGKEVPAFYPKPKKLLYAEIFLNDKLHMRICSHIDGKPVHEREINSYTGDGWRVVMPELENDATS
jgi:hypothetical protein